MRAAVATSGVVLQTLAICSVALHVSACNERERANLYIGDGTFGSSPPEQDAGDDDGSVSDDPDAEGPGSGMVQLRLFNGVLNLPAARFCHDPDYRADDPYTAEDEGDSGPLPPRLLLDRELDGGSLSLGVAAGYFELPAAAQGAIMVHRAPLPPDAGSDGGASYGGLEAGAGRDAGPTDAAVVDPCDPSSLESVLPLPLTAAWLEPPRPPDTVTDGGASDGGMDGGASDAGFRDAGLSEAGPMDASYADVQPTAPSQRGFATTLSGDLPLMLFGSGRSLDPKELATRRQRAREEYLIRRPGDDAGAEAAGRARVAWLESAVGPRFLLSRVPAPRGRPLELSLVHLVPDVPLVPLGVDAGAPTDQVSGPLHLCITIGTVESEPPDGGTARHEFRNVSPLGSYGPGTDYRFRLFVEADFARQPNCGETSLKPVAERLVPKGDFVAGRSYTLVVWGARSAVDLCTAFPNDTVVRPGCARPAETLNARIDVLENELPATQ